jgi:tryptophanase
MLPIFEPFRIKSVEPIRLTTRREREVALHEAGYNLFRLPADKVLIDLLTDSGTGAMSSAQWAAMMRGDESYAGASSFERFDSAVKEVFGLKHVIPTHQGRAAEHLLFRALVRPGSVVPSNTHFDTTRANLEVCGATAVDLPCPESHDTAADFPFKGNIDLAALADCLESNVGAVPLVMMTLTNNAGGGQPASLANVRAVRDLCDDHGVPLFIDACRFAENAWLVRSSEPGMRGRTVRSIVRDFFALADGCTMSAKKDGLANIGGFVAVNDVELATELRRRLVVTEGFETYGGMAGRDLDAVAQGLNEVVDEDYLAYRHASIRYVVDRLHTRGVPVLRPAGGHAVFLDAGRFLPHLPWRQYPGQALVIALYLEGGIRACEIGTVMLGRRDPATGAELPAEHELVRLAIPRRTYTQSHMDYVIEVVQRVWERRDQLTGVEIVEEPPVLRHFSARFAPVEAQEGLEVPLD